MNKTEFTSEQQLEIAEGTQAGLDVSIYAKPEFLAIQMREIRIGLADHLPVKIYATTKYDWFQMEEIRKGLLAKVDVRKYADPSISFDVMRQIRLGLESGVDLSSGIRFSAGVLKELRLALNDRIDIRKYIKQGYSEEQLREIRLALANGLYIDPYLLPVFRGPSIHEIALGLAEGLDVSVYAKEHMTWQQMREIRLGLEERLPVEYYQNPWYSWQQMREIRLGLEVDLPVEAYANLMYTTKEMKKRRVRLLEEHLHHNPQPEEKHQYLDFSVLLSEDQMQASVFVIEKGTKIKKQQLKKAMQELGIVYGIKEDVLDALEQNGAEEHVVVVAEGKEPTCGADGWYEFFFDRELKKKPQLKEDGSVDYQNIKCFEVVKEGQKIAVYHEETEGEPGICVDGAVVCGIKGKVLPPLTGRGFLLLPDQKTYVAALDGKIEWREGHLEVTSLLVLDNVTRADANVDFNGSVYVRGRIGEGVTIKATQDIVVDGYMEAASLEAGGDIVLRKGNNAKGKGMVRAQGSVMGNFFEHARIRAGGDIHANYCLNSELTAKKSIVITGRFGILAGGTAEAAVLVQSHDIGNQAGLATQIAVGRQERYIHMREDWNARMDAVQKELALLKSALHQFKKKLSPEMRNANPMYLKLEDAVYTKENEQKQLQQEKERLEQEAKKNKVAKVVVWGTIYPGVRLDINGTGWKARQLGNVTIKKSNGEISIYRNV